MRYVIINFTRLGDLLQTQSCVAALKKSTPCEVSLLCLEQFASAAHFIKELDDISVFPGGDLLKSLHSDWRQSFSYLDDWFTQYYQKYPYDVVINLTPSMACRAFSQYLSQKAKHVPVLGFFMDNMGFGQNSSVWTSYTQAVTQERGCSPFNLIDSFRAMLNVSAAQYCLSIPENFNKKNVEEQILKATTDAGLETHQKYEFVGLQLGASSEKRQWSVEHFAHLADSLWHKDKQVCVLFGAPSERGLVEKFSSFLSPTTPFIDLCGKTSLQELGYALCQCKALVSNDTGTLHLAVGLQVPVVGIYLATAQVWDTGPYGQGQLCLEPQLDCHPCSFKNPCAYEYRCQKYVSVQSVYDALKYSCLNSDTRLSEEEKRLKKQEVLASFPDDARLWQGFFEEDGFINYDLLSENTNDERKSWMLYQRMFYKNLLEKLEQIKNPEKQIQSHSYEAVTHNKQSEEFLDSQAEFVERLLTLLLLAKEQANMLKVRPNQKAQELFLGTIQRIELYLQKNIHFSSFLLLWKTLLQENSHKMDSLIQFFDINYKELKIFNDFMIKPL